MNIFIKVRINEICIVLISSIYIDSVSGIVVSIAAFQAVDPGSIPG